MGSKKNVDMSSTNQEVKIVTTETADVSEAKSQSTKKKKKIRSKKYVLARSLVDRTKHYTASEAIDLVQRTSYSKFVGSVVAHGVVKEVANLGNFTFPHSTGQSVRVAIVDEKILKNIEEGNLDFDVLVTTPQFMPKLAKFARVLGPKGLMPNPKNGTVSEKPELKKQELEAGSFDLKTEKKSPNIHVVIGKTDQPSAQLTENLEYLIKKVGTRLTRISIVASMGPSVKVKI